MCGSRSSGLCRWSFRDMPLRSNILAGHLRLQLGVRSSAPPRRPFVASGNALQIFDARRVGGLGLNRCNQAGEAQSETGTVLGASADDGSDEVALEVAALAVTIVVVVAENVAGVEDVAGVAGIDMHVVHGFRSARW